MDKNTWIGFGLIAVIIIGFSFFNRPSKEELAARQRVQDSIAVVRAMEQEAQLLSEKLAAEQAQAQEGATAQSTDALAEQVAALYGPFAPAAQGKEGIIVLENEKVRLGIAQRSGRIAKAELKEYKVRSAGAVRNVYSSKSESKPKDSTAPSYSPAKLPRAKYNSTYTP